MNLSILIVDDEPDLCAVMKAELSDTGHKVATALDGGEALALISSINFDVMICDVRLPVVDGLALLRKVRQDSPGTDVILMSGYAAVSDAVTALKEGARDYLVKPFDCEEIRLRLARIAEQRGLRRELEQARSALALREIGAEIVGSSPQMVRLLERIETIAQSDAAVLVLGESGTGKELVARTLHRRSGRAARPFVAVNCAAFPETLIEAELFGHERGAFTGAVRKRDGRFKAADGGTILLDEVAELPLPAQAKLLRVLQEGTIEPLGTNDALHVDVRVISATHRNLRERAAAGLFRDDLYYRLKVLDLEIPPLRDRHGDLPLLMQHFLGRVCAAGQSAPGFTPRALAAITQYAFPGNVRELAHAVEHAVVLSRGGEIDLHHLPTDIAGLVGERSCVGDDPRPLCDAMKEFEREYLARALRLAGGKRTRAAELLGISRKNLWEKIRHYGLADEGSTVEAKN